MENANLQLSSFPGSPVAIELLVIFSESDYANISIFVLENN